jgi:hypothetical protein
VALVVHGSFFDIIVKLSHYQIFRKTPSLPDRNARLRVPAWTVLVTDPDCQRD